MATFQQRGSRWRAIVRKKGHPAQSKSFRTKSQAQRWAKELEVGIDSDEHTGKQALRRLTLGRVLDTHREHLGRLSSRDRRIDTDIRTLKRHFGDTLPLSALDYAALAEFCTTRAREDQVKAATIGYNIMTLSGTLSTAVLELGVPAEFSMAFNTWRKGLARAGFIGRPESRDHRPDADRPEPANKLSPEEREAVVVLCNATEYRSRPPAFIVADQADKGRYLASESTMYRVLHEVDQQHHRGRQQAPQRKRVPPTHQDSAPNRLWCWDISWLPGPARGTWWCLYLIMAVFSRKIVGHEVYETETGELAAELIQKACWREHLSARHKPLILHSDNGSPMKAATFLRKLHDLGITSLYSRPRVSNDNAFAESAFKTLKYRPGFPVDGFATLAEAQGWVQQFTEWYNHEHRHGALRHVTPVQRHRGEAEGVLAQRREVFEAAKHRHPERWSGAIRGLSLPEVVHLNPDRDPVPQASGF